MTTTMVATTADRPGIISWAMTLRTTMANDPGRQYLEDQIQRDGFDFLDEYFANILAGPKRDPIIELVKTPGRKKDLPKKTRAATAAVARTKAIVSLSLDDDNSSKENLTPDGQVVPINNFHKTLLQQKQKSVDMDIDPDVHFDDGSIQAPPSPSPRKPAKDTHKKIVEIVVSEPPKITVHMAPNHPDNEEDEEKAVEELITPPHLRHADVDATMEPPLPAVSFAPQHSLLPTTSSTQDLSIIAEDEEPSEPSRQSIVAPPQEPTSMSLNWQGGELTQPSQSEEFHPEVVAVPAPSPDMAELQLDITHTSIVSHQTFESIPLDSPEIQDWESTGGFMTAHLPPSSTMQVSAMLEDSDYTVPLEEPLQHSTPSEGNSSRLTHKKSMSTLPNIGAPSPLRKSTRSAHDHTLVIAPPVVTPAAPAPATRSSWLVKAREVKAKEEIAKRLSTFPSVDEHGPSPKTFGSLKRKSADVFHDDIGEEGDRKTKSFKADEASPAAELAAKQPVRRVPSSSKMVSDFIQQIKDQEANTSAPEGMMDRLKKTVEGLSARVGKSKSMGKSLGGAAAAQALADARAAAEAKIAGRQAQDSQVTPQSSSVETMREPIFKQATPVNSARDKTAPQINSEVSTITAETAASRLSQEAQKRLSVSDLVVAFETKKKDSSEPPKVFQPPPPVSKQQPTNEAKRPDESTSTTPPNSPPPVASIFSKPQDYRHHSPSGFDLPPMTQPLPLHDLFQPQAFSAPRNLAPQASQLTYASTQSTFSDAIFDNDVPTWLPSTQDTEYTDVGGSQQSQPKGFTYEEAEFEQDMDVEPSTEPDESWHMDDKFAAGPVWNTVGMGPKDDSMTWSTLPTQSSNGKPDTGPQRQPSERIHESEVLKDKDNLLADIIDPKEPPEVEMDMDVEEEVELDDYRPELPKTQSTISLVGSQNTKGHSRSNSQASVTTTSQFGFLSTATKYVSSVLGGSKKGKAEPIKSIQLATAAAKKQQEEQDKKAVRMKEMEARRQQAMQKKADDEKAREDKRLKEEAERRKREKEREDLTKSIRLPTKKVETDASKKRLETDKKPDGQKAPAKEPKELVKSKIGKPPSNAPHAGGSKSAKPANATSAHLAGAAATIKLVSSSSTTEHKMETITPTPIVSSMKGKQKAKVLPQDDEITHPTRVMQSQMQARVEAQMAEIRKAEVAQQQQPPTENIELPDINSEYSDSEDEDRASKAVDLPDWAQSPNLREMLEAQSTHNPDDIFGAIKPLRMDEIFKTKTSRFRARTSSANWAGTDAVTLAEERAYAKRMGYKT